MKLLYILQISHQNTYSLSGNKAEKDGKMVEINKDEYNDRKRRAIDRTKCKRAD